MRYRSEHNMPSEAGFTIIEIGIVTVILGLIFSAGLLMISNMLSQKLETVTFKRMEVVADAISIYAQRHMRIPCPADNAVAVGAAGFGVEVNFTVAAGIGECITGGGNNHEGIVPYATLGIPQDYARDAWGNFFTYRVSPAATIDPTDPGLLAQPTGKWCLAQPVWNDGTTYMNQPKAVFCCGALAPGGVRWDRDILLMGPHSDIANPATALMPSRQIDGEGGEPQDYMAPAAGPPAIGDLQNRFSPLYPAYVLVSHGANRDGAFMGGGSEIPGPFLSVQEQENANRDIQFFVTDNISTVNPSATGGTDLFVNAIDDVVFWQSQAQVMSRVGETSCARPWNQ